MIDSRSVKTSRSVGMERGMEGGKKSKGRKQHIITETMGLILTVVIHAANVHDRKAAFGVIKSLRERFPGLSKIIVDGGYSGEWLEQVQKAFA